MTNIKNVLHEFQNLFLMKLFEMKGILGDLGEMKIPLKPDAKPMKQQLCLLNPLYKERIKAELDIMLDVGIIEPVEESEWIIPMVVQDKKIGEVHIFIDLRLTTHAFMIHSRHCLLTKCWKQ